MTSIGIQHLFCGIQQQFVGVLIWREFETYLGSSDHPPNKSPEPTRIVAVSCPQGFQWFHSFSSGWLSFLR